MKKIGMSVMVVLMAVLMVLATAACGDKNGGSSEPDVVGIWKVKFDAEKAPEDQKAAVQMMSSMVTMTMELSADKKAKVSISMNAMGQSSNSDGEGTWTQSGNTITVSGIQSSDPNASSVIDSDGKMIYKDGKLFMINSESSDGKEETVEYMYFEKQ